MNTIRKIWMVLLLITLFAGGAFSEQQKRYLLTCNGGGLNAHLECCQFTSQRMWLDTTTGPKTNCVDHQAKPAYNCTKKDKIYMQEQSPADLCPESGIPYLDT